MDRDYMALVGNSTSAEIKQRRKSFFKMMMAYSIRIAIIAILIFLTTK